MACNIQQAQRCLEQFSEAEGLQPGEQPGPANTIQVADEEGLNKVCGCVSMRKSSTPKYGHGGSADTGVLRT